ncbi:hypothetical protein QJQ45_024690 [Haematococcus lacustris]|nr:hypothetical protein QJQ45_024690 [Haematococcus lacustris]
MAKKKRKGTAKQKQGPTKELKGMDGKRKGTRCGCAPALRVPALNVTLATWDAVWEVYPDPKQARQRLRLYGAQDRALEQFFRELKGDMAEMSMEHHGHAKQRVVFFAAASLGTRGGWGADAVLRACCKVVCRPRGTDQLRGRVVLVDEHCTTRVSSAVNGKQPCEEGLDHEQPTRRAGWKPPAGQVHHRLLRPACSQQRDQPVWGLMDCNAALNMQRIGESRWRLLELCYWPEQGALPAKGKEYPGLGYKRLQDKPPMAQQQQQPPAEAQPRGTDQLRGRVVLVDEHRTTRVSSAVNGKQPWQEGLDHEQPTRRAGWKPLAGQVHHRLLRPAWSKQRDQPVRGLMWCPVVAPRKPPQAPCSSQAATQPAALEPGPSTPPPAKRSKLAKAEQAAEPTKGTGKAQGKAAKAKPALQHGR